MTKNLTWRLSKLPTPDEVRELVKDKIITQEEARDILFKSDEEIKEVEKQTKEKKVEELELEIKFLKELIDKLSNNNYYRIVQVVKEVNPPYPFYEPYKVWCNETTYAINNGTESMCQSFNSIS